MTFRIPINLRDIYGSASSFAMGRMLTAVYLEAGTSCRHNNIPWPQTEVFVSAKCEIKGWKLQQINKDSIRDGLKGREANSSLTFSGCSLLMTASSMFFPPDCTTCVRQREALGAWPGIRSNKPLSGLLRRRTDMHGVSFTPQL